MDVTSGCVQFFVGSFASAGRYRRHAIVLLSFLPWDRTSYHQSYRQDLALSQSYDKLPRISDWCVDQLNNLHRFERIVIKSALFIAQNSLTSVIGLKIEQKCSHHDFINRNIIIHFITVVSSLSFSFIVIQWYFTVVLYSLHESMKNARKTNARHHLAVGVMGPTQMDHGSHWFYILCWKP